MGNALLAEAISDISDHRFCSVLPQNFPEGKKSLHRVRDDKLLTLLECDLALFNFDGAEIEAGAVVEFMTAKFADIPTVILRTDSRGQDEGEQHPWSLMMHFFPRTEVEVLNASAIYQNVFEEFPMSAAEDVLIEERSSEVAHTMVRVIAQAVIDAFDRVLETPSRIEPQEAPHVYSWLARFFGAEISSEECNRILQRAMARKQNRGLIPVPKSSPMRDTKPSGL
ncbi:hypothetical protein GCM10007047_32040 [Cerasicoccus arenae]|uniref:Nucleoside 2-deoxyribosyltransferase n=2 Tax=Cerasicoccus arenae TaxID=424488 RepID=A0A8J3DMN7_9BACT|nr:hypothetical protein GCM10007047_32040 [Cerasicoccus arenae]